MGSGGSSPRRVTVENEDEDTIGVVKISESLFKEPQESNENTPSADEAKKLMQELLDQKQELDYQQDKIDDLLQDAFEQGRLIELENNVSGFNSAFVEENLRKSLQEKENTIAELRTKKQMFEEEQIKKSVELEKVTTKEFNDGIDYMQKRYSNKKAIPVCSSMQSQVLKCYNRNRQQSLKCSQLVKAYVECVEQARKTMIKQKQ